MKLLGIGAALVDLISPVNEAYLKKIKGDKGGMEYISAAERDSFLEELKGNKNTQDSGGSVANTLCMAAQNGIDCNFYGRLGSDSLATFFKEKLQSRLVQTQTMIQDPQEGTGTCISLISPDGERTLRTLYGASGNWTPEEIKDSPLFKEADAIFIEPYLLFNEEIFDAVIHEARKNQLKTILGMGSFEVVKSFQQKLLQNFSKNKIDILFANEDEAREFSGTHDLEESIQALNRMAKLSIMTLGKSGSWAKAINEKEILKTESIPVPSLDSTGAGDAFAGAFLSQHFKSKSLLDSLHFANKIGAETVKVLGAHISQQ